MDKTNRGEIGQRGNNPRDPIFWMVKITVPIHPPPQNLSGN